MAESGAGLAARIDHTLLDPLATGAEIERLCDQAMELGFAAVCVNPIWVPFCVRRVNGSPIHVCSVAGFPLGASLTEVRVLEVRRAVEQGAHEVDVVIQLGVFISGEHAAMARDLESIVAAAKPAGVKAILETGRLSREEAIAAARIAAASGVAFVKTSTGFAGSGATVESVALLREVVGSTIGVKASGGIRSLEQAVALIQAGASRLGTSAGVEIVRDMKARGTSAPPAPARPPASPRTS